MANTGAWAQDKAGTGAHDLIINGHGYMLKRVAVPDPENPKELLQTLAWKQERMQFAPGSPTPEAQPFTIEPDFEIPSITANFDQGIGYRMQSSKADRDIEGIWYGRYMDKSGDWLHPAAAVTTVTPTQTDASQGGNQFIEFTSGGTRKLVCAMGQYLKVRNADTAAGWATAKDFGAGAKITGLEVFRGTQAGPYLFIAMGSQQNYWVWDGTSDTTTFTQHATLKAWDFVTFHDEIWKLDQDANARWQVSLATDGGTAPTWGGATVMTDNWNTAKHLAIHKDQLYIRTEQGVKALNSAENDVQDTTGDTFKGTRTALNECRPVSFAQWLISNVNSTWFLYDPNGSSTFQEMGPETLKNTESAVYGTVTANAPYGWQTVFYAMYNPANSTAYLMRWGEWKFFETMFHPIPERIFVNAHIGALWEQTAQINGMIVSQIGAPNSGQYRLYWVDAVGAIHSIDLPRGSYNYYGDSSAITFQTANTTEIYGTATTAHVPTIDKVFLGVDLAARNLTTANYVTFQYRTNTTDSYGNATNLENSGQFTISPGQRNNLTTNVKTKWIDWRLQITNTSASAAPGVNAVALYTLLVPVYKNVFDGIIIVSDNMLNRRGIEIKDQMVADVISYLEAIATSGVISITVPDGRTFDVVCTHVGPAIPTYRDPGGRSISWEIPVRFLQHRSVTTQGSENRLAAYTETQLASYTEAALLTL